MLRLIVLGLVPGTDIQLSFMQIVGLVVVFYASLLLLHEHKQHRVTTSDALDKLAI